MTDFEIAVQRMTNWLKRHGDNAAAREFIGDVTLLLAVAKGEPPIKPPTFETERDRALTEHIQHLRAEAAMVDAEEGTDCTTRACLLRGAADEIERLRQDSRDGARLYVKAMSTIDRLTLELAAEAKIRRYIAFVLTGDEASDAQLAADGVADRLAAAQADERRLQAAGIRVGIVAGCDTPEWMADEIETLRDNLTTAVTALRQVRSQPPLTPYAEICQIAQHALDALAAPETPRDKGKTQ